MKIAIELGEFMFPHLDFVSKDEEVMQLMIK